MASTKIIGNKKEITIRDDVFESVEEAIDYYGIVATQFYQVKSFFRLDEPHKAIMACLNYNINKNIHRSVNLSKYLQFISGRITSITELIIRSDSKALNEFLKLEEKSKTQVITEKVSIKEEPKVSKEQQSQPNIDFSSFNGSQDYNKIGMQFVLASNVKALKDFVEILNEVSFPIPADKVYQLHSDLEPIQKMVNDSMEIINNLVEEGKTY